jgi:hypothetical protein
VNGPLTSWTDQDFDVVFRTLYGEARGEPIEGQTAVIYTMVNRALLARTRPIHIFGNGSLASVCQAPWQYSCMNPGPIRSQLLLLKPGSPGTARVCATVLGVLLGDLTPPTEPWWSPRMTHYHVATDPFPSGWTPNPKPDDWQPPSFDGIIGKHAFYSEEKVP